MLQRLTIQTHYLISKSFFLVCFSLATADVFAQATEGEATDDQETVSEAVTVDSLVTDEILEFDDGYQAKTVYVDARWGSRTNGSAKALTQSHKKYAAMGFKVVDIELYLENSDLRGFFVTYERDTAKDE